MSLCLVLEPIHPSQGDIIEKTLPIPTHKIYFSNGDQGPELSPVTLDISGIQSR